MRLLNENLKRMKSPNLKFRAWIKRNESIISIFIKAIGETIRVLVDMQ